MKIEKIYQFYKASEEIFRCPICHEKMKVEKPASMLCGNGHCFDISRDGYVNYLPNQKRTKYNKEMFESRRVLFENGYYEPLVEEICRLVEECTKGKGSFSVLDAGCGEGYYDCFLQKKLEKADIYAVDNMKEAIKMGAKKCKEVRWLVANLANLPIWTNTMDMVLEIFAPSSYSEFERILKEDGYLVKILPGQGYLKELRERIDINPDMENYTSQRVEEHFCKHMALQRKMEICYMKTVDKVMIEHFLQMTPMMFSRNASEVDINKVDKLTFEFVILLGRKRGVNSCPRDKS